MCWYRLHDDTLINADAVVALHVEKEPGSPEVDDCWTVQAFLSGGALPFRLNLATYLVGA
jgi:hypothetical protein